MGDCLKTDLHAQLLVLHPLYRQYHAFPKDNTLRRSSGQAAALLSWVGKMSSKVQSCWQGSGTNHEDTKDTKIDRSYIS